MLEYRPDVRSHTMGRIPYKALTVLWNVRAVSNQRYRGTCVGWVCMAYENKAASIWWTCRRSAVLEEHARMPPPPP